MLQQTNRRIPLRVNNLPADLTLQAIAFQQALLERTSLIVITTSPEGMIRSFNRAAEIHLGYSAEDLIDKVPFQALFRREDISARGQQVSAETEEVSATGFEVFIMEARHNQLQEQEWEGIHRSGNAVPLLLSIAGLYDDHNEIIGFVAVARDLTERRRREAERRQLEKQLFQAQRLESVGTLAGGIAHDFNNILTAIIGNIQLLRRQLPPGIPAAEYLRDIDTAASRATSLTRQLLTFSRRQHTERSSVDLNEVINNLLKMLQRIIGEDIEIAFHPAPDLPWISGDISQLEQILINVAVNSRDAMPGGGQLRISTSFLALTEPLQCSHSLVIPGEYLRLSISDNGSGMDAETQASAFEPFFTTKQSGAGTGLGLSVIYGIVKQHNGYVHLVSEPGHGATFEFYFPALRQVPETKMVSLPKPQVRGGTETILLAEDEGALRKVTYELLCSLGYTVLLAENGIEAAGLYKKQAGKISLLLFDVVMPQQSGKATLEEVRRLGCRAPVIFMTGYDSQMESTHLPKDSTVSILQKPYTLESLGLVVREALDKIPSLPSSPDSEH